jgi:hypothetical protein
VTNLFFHILTDEEIDLLQIKLSSGENISVNRSEREFLAELVKLFGHEKMKPREANNKLAHYVAENSLIAEMMGEKVESLVSRAEENYGLSRSTFFNARRERRAFHNEMQNILLEKTKYFPDLPETIKAKLGRLSGNAAVEALVKAMVFDNDYNDPDDISRGVRAERAFHEAMKKTKARPRKQTPKPRKKRKN